MCISILHLNTFLANKDIYFIIDNYIEYIPIEQYI